MSTSYHRAEIVEHCQRELISKVGDKLTEGDIIYFSEICWIILETGEKLNRLNKLQNKQKNSIK